MMGGKSRKSGKISMNLINRIKKKKFGKSSVVKKEQNDEQEQKKGLNILAKSPRRDED